MSKQEILNSTSYLARAYTAKSDSTITIDDENSSSDEFENDQKDPKRKPGFTLSQWETFCTSALIGILIAGVALAVVLTLYFQSSSTKTTTTSSTTTTTTTSSTTTTETTTTTTTSSSTTSTTSTSTSTAAITLPASGPILNLDPAILSGAGWTECYNSTYAVVLTPSVVADVLTKCNKSKLSLACRPVTAINYTLAAMGLRSDVLFDCSTTSGCTNVANGVGWYFNNAYSWGFVSGTDAVTRSSCDTASTNPSYRLCWHTGSSGGYRCGSTTSLNSATTWQRSIWHTN